MGWTQLQWFSVSPEYSRSEWEDSFIPDNDHIPAIFHPWYEAFADIFFLNWLYTL